MLDKSTLAHHYRSMAGKPDCISDHCVVCGATYPLNNHHVIWRSWGNLYNDGRKLRKPVLTLCGSGNTGGCHKKAHDRHLHFRWNYEYEQFEFIETDETDYLMAQQMDGWKLVEP